MLIRVTGMMPVLPIDLKTGNRTRAPSGFMIHSPVGISKLRAQENLLRHGASGARRSEL